MQLPKVELFTKRMSIKTAKDIRYKFWLFSKISGQATLEETNRASSGVKSL